MHSLANHLAMKVALSVPKDFGENFTYAKLFYGKCQDGKKDRFVTVEKYIEDEFVKCVNNDEAILIKVLMIKLS